MDGRRERMRGMGAFRGQVGHDPDHLQKRLTGRRQLGAMRDTVKELRVDLPLEILDLGAERRLRDADPRSGAREVLFIGER